MHITLHVNLISSLDTTKKNSTIYFCVRGYHCYFKRWKAVQRNKKEATDATLIPRLKVDVDWLCPRPRLGSWTRHSLDNSALIIRKNNPTFTISFPSHYFPIVPAPPIIIIFKQTGWGAMRAKTIRNNSEAPVGSIAKIVHQFWLRSTHTHFFRASWYRSFSSTMPTRKSLRSAIFLHLLEFLQIVLSTPSLFKTAFQWLTLNSSRFSFFIYIKSLWPCADNIFIVISLTMSSDLLLRIILIFYDSILAACFDILPCFFPYSFCLYLQLIVYGDVRLWLVLTGAFSLWFTLSFTYLFSNIPVTPSFLKYKSKWKLQRYIQSGSSTEKSSETDTTKPTSLFMICDFFNFFPSFCWNCWSSVLTSKTKLP